MAEHEPIPSVERLGDEVEAAATRALASSNGSSAADAPRSRPRSSRRRRLLLAPLAVGFAAVVVFVAVAIVAARQGGDDVQAQVIAAADRTSAANTGTFSLSIAIDTESSSGFRFTADGAYDNGAGRMKVSVDSNQLLLAFSGDAPGAQLPKTDIVVDQGHVYASLPDLATGGKGTSWIRLDDLGGLNLLPGASGSGATAPSPPVELLDIFDGLEHVDPVGTEDVGGVRTTHYRGAVDLGRAYDDLSPEERERLAASVRLVGGSLPADGSIPVDVWIDDAGLVRRLSSYLEVASVAPPTSGLPGIPTPTTAPPATSGTAPKGPGGVQANTVRAAFTLELRDVDQPVSITVPPPDQVTSVTR